MLKFIARMVSHIWLVVLTIGFALSLAFNVAVVAVSSFSTAVSAAYEALTGTASAISDIKNRLTKSEAQVADLTAERGRLRQETTRLTEELSGAERRVANLSDDVARKEGRIARLSDDIASRNKQLLRATDEAADLRRAGSVTYRGERRLLRDAMTDVNGRIARRTATAASRNASSVVAEAIPYLGIAAMLGVTAYDLKDSCDTIKDLHELDVSIDPTKAFSADAQEVCGMEVPTREVVWASVKSGAGEAWQKASDYVPDLPAFEMSSLRDMMFWK